MTRWFRSRTVNWAAVIAALGVVQAQFEVFKPFFDRHPEMYGVLLMVVAALMTYLRLTHKPVDGQ
jgi:hypothetical protein